MTAFAGTWTDIRFDFTGAHVLVTGGTGGIGAAVAAAYRAAGAEVTVTGTRPGAADYAGGLDGLRYLQLNLSDKDQVDAVARALPRLDILVDNAGSALYRPGIDMYDADVFAEAVEMNLLGVYRLTRGCYPLLRASRWPGGASVVIVSSETAFLANELVPGYGAAKGGLLQMTRTLGAAWGREGIRVNTVGPGLTESGMTTGMTDADTLPYRQRTPLGRIGRASDVAGAVLFLSSSAAGFITGQMLPIEGGHSIVG